MNYATADKRIEQGAWLCELDQCAPIYDARLELSLIQRAQAGDRAASDRLIRAQLKWLVNLAKRVSRPDGMELDEVISAGVEAVLLAIRDFKASAGGRLSTYAEYRARVRMWRYVKENDSLIFIPDHMSAPARLEALHGTRLRYMSESVGGEKGQADDTHGVITLGDTIPAPTPAPAQPNDARDRVYALFDRALLTNKERAAMIARYLTWTETPTCAEVGEMLNISEQAAYLRIKSAIRKLQIAAGVPVTKPHAVKGRKRGAA